MRWWLFVALLFVLTCLLAQGLAEPDPRPDPDPEPDPGPDPEARRRSRRPKGSNSRGRDWLQQAEDDEADSQKSPERSGKLFSLFNIIQFSNSVCRSLSTISSGGTGSTNRNGTCFTTNECTSRGGAASGSCAAGFGVCCIFLVSTSGATVTQNCTYVRNPGFPNAYTSTNGVQFTIRKCSNNVCFLRLDFESFTLQGTGNTLEVDTAAMTSGGVCLDTFDVQVSTNQRIPTICGQNTGQHMYVDIGLLASDTATLNFAFSGTTTNRLWEIKVSQIPCYNECSKDYQPPDGCLQYHTGLTGRFTTFNFIPTNDNHLANQDYSVCIRQEKGFCCIQYMPCTDANSFTIDTLAMMMSETDSGCTLDYVGISGSFGSCNQGSSRVPVVNKYCGPVFNSVDGIANNAAVCDCTQPFIVDIFTDALTDAGDTATPNTAQSRGVCLTWMQIPCNT